MLDNKYILSLGIIAAFSASTSAQAFHSNAPIATPYHQNFIMVSSEPLEDGAKSFVAILTEKGLGVLKSTKNGEETRITEFREILKNGFDMKTIARFSLGRYWRTSSKAEQKEYLKLFEEMIIEVYSRRFSDYKGQMLNITSTRTVGKSDVLVSSILVPEHGPKIDVDWRVRNKKDGQYKIIDIIVEGISMSLTQRSDFASVIQRGGGKTEVLLMHLRPKDKISTISKH